MKIAVGFLIAYDYAILKHSLPLGYASADKIVLSLDDNRLTWAGQNFSFDNEFKKWIQAFDRQGKVEWKEEHYYIRGNSPMEKETRQRTCFLILKEKRK